MASISRTLRSATLNVGIGEMAVSTDTRETLITYSLGSCIGVTVYDPEARIGGLIHCLLPASKLDTARAEKKPAMFTDTGIVALLRSLMDLGAVPARIIIKVAGAGSPTDPEGRFRIGDRNMAVLRKVLEKNDLPLHAEDVGGTVPRTITLSMATGITGLHKNGVETEL